MVTVYHFKIGDGQYGQNVVQPLKSTAERIAMIGGETLLETAEEVDERDVIEGQYRQKKRE